MTQKSLLLSFLLISITCFAIPPLCQGQDGTSLKVVLNPKPDDNDSMDWWKRWRPSWEDTVSFRAELSGNMEDLDTNTGGFIKSTTYIFTFPEGKININGEEYDATLSSYPGYCMNANVASAAGIDIEFQTAYQTSVQGLEYKVSSDKRTLTGTCNTPKTFVDVTAFVKDYAAHGVLQVTVEINKDTNVSATATDDITITDALSIPLDNNGNDIADGWFGDGNATVAIGGGNSRSGYDPWADDETGPVDNSKHGDGITAFEEYRGFEDQVGHTSEDKIDNPLLTKDLFVYSVFSEGYGYASNLPQSTFKLHLINQNQMQRGTRRINIHRCGAGKTYQNQVGLRPQDAVHVENGSNDDDIAQRFIFESGVVLDLATVPYKVKNCYIFPTHIERSLKWMDEHPNLNNMYDNYYENKLKGVIGHEIGHCIYLFDRLTATATSIMEIGSSPAENNDQKRWNAAKLVQKYKMLGYLYPEIHNNEYMLVDNVDRRSHRNRMVEFEPKRTKKPQWPRTESTNTEQIGQNDGESGGNVNASPAPDQPYGLSYSMVDGQFRLSWTDGGGTVTGFQYQYRVPGGSWSSWISAGTGTFIDLLNLVNGTTYQIQVRAMNGTVASATSDTFEVRVPTVPGAPTITRVDSGDGQVNINWTAPSNDGGSDITEYEYQYRESGSDTWEDWISFGGGVTSTSEDIAGLTNGTTYEFKVRAVNAVGEGAESSSMTATPQALTPPIVLTPPGAPINLSGTRGDGTVTLTWTKPSSSGSSPITHYKYRYATGVYPNISAWTEWTSTEDTDTSITVSSLTNGTEHFFQVRAFNNAGKGPVANNLFITPGIPPGAPVLSATGGNGQVTLNWIPPTYSGTASITHYEYRYAVDFSPGNYNFTKWKSTGSATTSFIVTGLTNGKNHFFQLRAVNGHGLNTRANNVFVTPNNSQ